MPTSADNVLARGLVSVSLVLGAAVLGAQTQSPVSAPDPVVVDLAVTRNGKPVTGLTAADITLREGGAVQAIDVVAGATQPLDVVLVLDASASVRGEALAQLQAALRAAIAALRPDDHAAVLTFSQSVSQRSALTGDRVQLTAATLLTDGQGSTSLADAAFAALAMKRRAPRTLYLVFSDGDDLASWLSAADVVRAAQRGSGVISGAMIAAPGHTGAQIARAFGARDKAGADARAQIGKWLLDDPRLYRAALLPMLAIETGGETVQLPDTSRLASVFTDLIARHTQRYLVRYTPKDAPAPGFHPIEIEIRGGGDVAARRGYLK